MDTLGAILDAGRDLFLEVGPAGLSIPKVAQRVGLPATAVGRHFADKDALVLAIYEKGADRLAQYLYRGLGGQTAAARLALSAEAYLDFALEQSGYYAVLFMSAPGQLGMTRLAAQARAALAPSRQYLVDRVQDSIAVGDFAPADPQHLATTIWSHCHGLVALWLNGLTQDAFENQVTFAAFYGRACRQLYAGLGTAP